MEQLIRELFIGTVLLILFIIAWATIMFVKINNSSKLDLIDNHKKTAYGESDYNKHWGEIVRFVNYYKEDDEQIEYAIDKIDEVLRKKVK